MLTVRYIIPCRELSYTYIYKYTTVHVWDYIYFIRGLSALSFLCELGNAKAWTRGIGQVESHVSVFVGVKEIY